MVNYKRYWEKDAKKYVYDLSNKYHEHRLDVIWRLLPKELFKSKKIFDFGCGDAVLFPKFINSDVFGVDPCQNIIDAGRKRLEEAGLRENLIETRGVEFLKTIPKESLDAVLCFNVLAYMSSAEEKEFYKQSRRILKKGGYLAVSHSNELFDMFSLNGYTVNFFKKNFNSNIKGMLKNVKTVKAYNNRENPLAYKYKLAKYGFNEIKQEFSNLHPAPPALLKKIKNYPDTNVKESEKWKLAFVCSVYMSLSQKM